MTTETHFFIEPQDILGIELECVKCGTKLSLKPGGFGRRIRECPSCQEVWLEPDTQEHRLVGKFLADVEALNGSLEGRNFTLRIQINRPE